MKSTLIVASLFALAFAAPATKRANLQTFTGALGGIAPTPIENSGNPDRPFQVKGDTFVNIGAALQRSCDQQFNACANKANGGDKTLSVSACSAQQTQCNAAPAAAAPPVASAPAAVASKAATPVACVVATPTPTPTPTVVPCTATRRRRSARAGNKARMAKRANKYLPKY
ncbi:hypothetical protein K505DRAFT_301132 [Melanomma pulvis-pyrius CBS 109.77]|uniref:Uncharacterized protein n=1 Tax=Melanomma pulvis-pyrius CBS 109.77 TaxID=1314802 RepID=A0A6A6XKC1_9PLEO|nr:hypothetical protein K505DRAFT_301132 [Melanomma pulvis-pyrius CBS 109.77]